MSSEQLNEEQQYEQDDDEISNADVKILTLRKPTPLKKILDSVPKPETAVPRNGLPNWWRLALDQKLPVPKIPAGKITFSRGYLGEDVRRCYDETRPAFDLSDPFCHTVSYAYEPLHDPHLTRYFAQPLAKARMLQLGLANREGQAVCSLKEFNNFRKYLYNRYMDKVHNEMRELDILATDNLTLKRVDRDVARRGILFNRKEKAREHMERVAREHADEAAEKKRLAREREAKNQARVQYLIQFKERQQRERILKGREKERLRKQRVQTAEEMELRRKITMIRTWRKNEKRRLARLKREHDEKKRNEEEKINRTWEARIESQNNKIAQDNELLRMYTEDMSAGALRRQKRAEIKAYNTDLELQKIRLKNWKALHGKGKSKNLVNTVATIFAKTRRDRFAVTPSEAKLMAKRALADAASGGGTDRLALLGQARARLEHANTTPIAVTTIIDEALNMTLNEYARRHVGILMSNLESDLYSEVVQGLGLGRSGRNMSIARRKSRGQPRRSIPVQQTLELARQYMRQVSFGEIATIGTVGSESDIAMRSVKDRPPTPVTSTTDLVEMIFHDRKEDLLEPVAISCNMPERRKLLEMINTLNKLLSRTVRSKVQRGVHVETKNVTLPRGYRHSMDWNEAVEALANCVLQGRVNADSADVRRGCDYLSRRILLHVITNVKNAKREKKLLDEGKGEPAKDFYIPGDYNTDETQLNTENTQQRASSP